MKCFCDNEWIMYLCHSVWLWAVERFSHFPQQLWHLTNTSLYAKYAACLNVKLLWWSEEENHHLCSWFRCVKQYTANKTEKKIKLGKKTMFMSFNCALCRFGEDISFSFFTDWTLVFVKFTRKSQLCTKMNYAIWQLFWCLLSTDNSAIVLWVIPTWKKKTIYRLSLCIVAFSFLFKVTMLQKDLPWSTSFNLGGAL